MRLIALYEFQMRLEGAVALTAARVHQCLNSYLCLLNFCPARFQGRAIVVFFPLLKIVDSYDKESPGNETRIKLRCEKW